MAKAICEQHKCTGCGMCTNICPRQAIQMVEGLNGFVYPSINENLCDRCGLCNRKCPSNAKKVVDSTIAGVYVAWNKDKNTRKKSSSGGIFTLLAEEIIKENGVVVGVAWDEDFNAKHVLIDNEDSLHKLQGSKYVQSDTGNIYWQVKSCLLDGRKVLFSGTPCQNSALKAYLGKDYENLYQVDLVCHGVPSAKFLREYLGVFNKKIKQIRLRYKDPYWDYSFVRFDFCDRTKYQVRTVDDPYFNLFNVGYSIRESCHECVYTSLNRKADITIGDFWGYRAHDVKTLSYNLGTSLVLVNSKKGDELFGLIANKIFCEKAKLESAIRSNKSLREPYRVDDSKLNDFWDKYKNGVSIIELDREFTAQSFRLPKHLLIRRIINKYRWIIKNE